MRKAFNIYNLQKSMYYQKDGGEERMIKKEKARKCESEKTRELSKLEKKLFKSGGEKVMKKKLELGLATSAILALLSVLICSLAYAGPEVSIDGQDWDIGIVAPGETNATSGGHWTITGSSDGNEDIDIRVESSGSWEVDENGGSGVNKFGLRETNSSGKIIKATNVRLADQLPKGQTYPLDLWVIAPLAGSEGRGHTLSVILTASNWIPVYSISGTITGSTTSGVTMTLSGHESRTTTSAGNGNYSFTDLTGGYNYTVTPSKTDYVFTPTSRSYSPLSSHQTNQNFDSAPACNGWLYDGFCWYNCGAQSCDSCCASRGGCVAAGIDKYKGNTNCPIQKHWCPNGYCYSTGLGGSPSHDGRCQMNFYGSGSCSGFHPDRKRFCSCAH